MKGKLNDRDAKCPFFCAHTKDSILCEGLIPDSRIKINFDGADTKRTQYSIFCCWRYENCEMYRALQEKYQEES